MRNCSEILNIRKLNCKQVELCQKEDERKIQIRAHARLGW